MLTGVNMKTKGGFKECTLKKGIQLAKSYMYAGLPINMLFNFKVIGFKQRNQ